MPDGFAGARRRSFLLLLTAVVIGAMAGLDTYRRLTANPQLNALDFTYPWRAARYVAHGDDPYRHMTPAPDTQGGPFAYPLPTALITLPLANTRVTIAATVFMSLSVALLVVALGRNGYWRLLMLTSAPFFMALWNVQWAPLLIASTL